MEVLNIFIVVKTFFAHNSFLNIGDFTPYIGLTDKHPFLGEP